MAWVLLLAGCVLGAAGLGRPGPLPGFDGLPLWLGLGALLELSSPRFPRFGFMAAGPGLWLGLVCLVPAAAWAVALAAAASLLLRLGRSARPAGWGLLELLADLQALLLALGLSRVLGQPLLAPALWWLFWWFQPALLAGGALESGALREWSGYRARVTGIGLGIALLGALAAWLNPAQRGAPLLLAGALACLARSSRFVVAGVDADSQTSERRRRERGLNLREVGLEKLEEGLQETDKKQRRTAAELEIRLETYQLMDEMLETIPRRPVFQAVADLLLERLQRRFRVTNALLLWFQDGRWLPVASATAFPDRVAAAPLTQVQEPVVERALRTGQLQVLQTREHSEARLFPEDFWSLAIPVHSGKEVRGAFYLGDPRDRNLSDEDAHFLLTLSRRSVLALDSAAWYQTLQTSLQREAAVGARNEALVQRLALVIDGVTQLIRLRDPAAMLERAGSILRSLVPHTAFYACTGEIRVSQGEAVEAELAELAARVSAQGLPLMLEGPARLAVPMVHDQGGLGALVLGRAEAFAREDQDILSVLSYQLTSALVTAQLYAELHKTHEALRDSQAQLVQSSKMAAIGQLAGGVAHELNTPLGAIALAVEAAQMNLQNKPERAAARLERASKAVHQMKEIVSKLLFYSRDARSGWRETNLNEVIEDTLQLVGHQLRLDSIEVVRQFGEVPRIQANPNELQQIFTNLVLNARDAMLSPGATGRRLVLSTGGAPGGCWARVLDQGCGIPADVCERIFEPFFTTKDVGKGTGLGLSVTAQLVEQHGGTVSVTSQPGKGSQFEVRLPLTLPEQK